MDKWKNVSEAQLTAHLKERSARCPICGGDDVQVYSEPGDDGESSVHQGSLCFPRGSGQANVGPWMVPLICSGCGYVMLFDARKIRGETADE